MRTAPLIVTLVMTLPLVMRLSQGSSASVLITVRSGLATSAGTETPMARVPVLSLVPFSSSSAMNCHQTYSLSVSAPVSERSFTKRPPGRPVCQV